MEYSSAHRDVFISHASEDKQEVARPLAKLLNQSGLTVWLDENELQVGDSLMRKIDEGLSRSKYGVVVLSKFFFEKDWTRKELSGLFSREGGQGKVVLPVWHNMTLSEIREASPLLADRYAANTKDGLPAVAQMILRAVRSSNTPRFMEADQARVSATTPAGAVGRAQSIDSMMVGYLDQVLDLAEQPAQMVGLPTGLTDFDRFLGGLLGGELYVISARPRVDKTSMALTLVQHAAIVEGLPVFYASCGVRRTEFLDRLLASVGKIKRHNLATGRLNINEWTWFAEAVERMRQAHIYVKNDPNLSLLDVVEESRRLASELGKLGLVVVEGLDLLIDVSTAEAIGLSIRRCRQLAGELDCPVAVLLTAPRTRRVDSRPMVEDLPGSDEIEKNARAVVFLHQPVHEWMRNNNSGVMELIVAQHHGGLTGTVKVSISEDSGRLESLATSG